jgi:hypothetical protein
MTLTTSSLRAIGFSLAVAALPQISQADPFLFDTDDLLLGVQATGGTGTSQNVFFNLGNTVDIKNTPNQGVVGNIAADLSATFGAGWFSRTDLVFGVIGNRSNLSPTIEPGTPPQEPGRTFYVSRAASSAGTAALRSSFGSGTLGTGGTNFLGIKNYLVISIPPTSSETFTATASGATILDETLHPTSWNNSWTKWNPPAGAAGFGVFSGGIQNSFGTGSEVFVDVQRMVANTPTTYVTTVGIASTGAVRLFTASVATPYQTWALTFPALDTPAKRLATADPDNDGTVNLLEFMLNGNPGVSDPSILPDLDASGTNFVFTFNRRDDSEAGATLLFQYGSDLAGWTNAAIGAGSSVVGSATITVVENGTAPDTITVSVPKSVAVGGKLFGRLSYTQP